MLLDKLQTGIANYISSIDDKSIYRVNWRFYHGWHRGKTKTADRLIFEKYLFTVRSRTIRRVSFGADFSFSEMLCCGSRRSPILDTLRLDQDTGRLRQKMVDTGLICDLLQRAKRQQEAAPLPPILHVASRGKKISVLNQVLAESIDLIRAKFTFDQVPALIRHNLLQVAIDGFDELVDAEGYRDAWSALKQFFEDTIYGGPIILAVHPSSAFGIRLVQFRLDDRLVDEATLVAP
jgi:hypothetical protein